MGTILRLKAWILLKIICLLPVLRGAIMPPPWADPKLNPCANEPRGWQLLFWPPDGQCYKIFQMGHPCPEGMELSPATSKTGRELYAECRCPPKTALFVEDGKCYQIFSSGPCPEGQYFAPDTQFKNNITTSNQQIGACKPLKKCSDSNAIYWHKDEKCYQRLTRGPCPKGLLLTTDTNKLPVCTCNKQTELGAFRASDGHCYQPFTKGPCKEKGFLFLPDRTCGCLSFLPHYHVGTKKCYELGTIGPCSTGEMFTVLPKTSIGGCVCKPGNIRYLDHPSCHRPFTQGPCPPDHILVNSTACIAQPCARGHLYYPPDGQCYKIGSRGACPKGQIVSFDFDTRPSIDGVSYNAVCACVRPEYSVKIECDRKNGLIRYGDKCFKLYAQGPCPKGAWLAPKRQGRELLMDENEREGVCECVPGNLRRRRKVGGAWATECLTPTHVLADYLNRNFTSVHSSVDLEV